MTHRFISVHRHLGGTIGAKCQFCGRVGFVPIYGAFTCAECAREYNELAAMTEDELDAYTHMIVVSRENHYPNAILQAINDRHGKMIGAILEYRDKQN